MSGSHGPSGYGSSPHSVRTASALLSPGREMDDLRYALRGFRRNPAFFAVAALTLALGIGATTAIFSIVDGVLLRPLPYVHGDRLIQVHASWNDTPVAALSPAEAVDLERDFDGAVEAFGVYASGSANLTGPQGPERVVAGYASSGAMAALGIRPALGRLPTADEHGGSGAAVLLTDALWRSRFAADPGVLERTVQVDGEPVQVVGVLPPGFRLPEDLTSPDPARLLLPLGLVAAEVDPTDRGSHFLSGLARLRPTATVEAARVELAGLAGRWRDQYPGEYVEGMQFDLGARPMASHLFGPLRPALLVLLGAVGVVLLIACANVANLMLTRSDARSRELAVRAAMGATRLRVARQMAIESLVLGALGGIAGVALGSVLLDAILAFPPPELAGIDDLSLDGRILAFATATTLLTVILFGLVPALRVSRTDAGETLRSGRRTVSDRRGARFRSRLVIAQLAFSVLLLTGAGLLLRSFVHLLSVDPGYDTERILTARVALPTPEYAANDQRVAFFEALVVRLDALPGVATAGAASRVPLAQSGGDLNFRIEGRPLPDGAVSPRADWQAVTPGYMEALGLRLLEGRLLTRADRADAPGAVVISRATARRYWPDGDARGARFELGGGAGPGTVTVVGIVEDVRDAGLDVEPVPQMYLTHAQFRFWGSGDAVATMSVVLRTTVPPATLAGAVADAVRELDADLPVYGVATMAQVRARSVARPRVTFALIACFAALALLIAAVGVYGVMAAAVGRRRAELGVRMALGADSASVARLVLGHGLRLATFGLAIGLAGALAAGRIVRSLLYGVGPDDPLTFAGVALVLTAAVAAACALPALRAARLQPVQVLRQD
jgi:putative ABC transport system permease protein